MYQNRLKVINAADYGDLLLQNIIHRDLKPQNILVSGIAGLEFLNKKFDPLDLKLNGWSNTVRDNVSDYDEIFIELIEKS